MLVNAYMVSPLLLLNAWQSFPGLETLMMACLPRLTWCARTECSSYGMLPAFCNPTKHARCCVACCCLQVVVRIVVLAFLLLSCLVVTKLMSINTDMANTIRWNMTALQSNISSAMRTYPANTTANQPLGSAIDATRFASSHTGPVDSRSPWGPFQASVAATYCNSHLPGTCQAALNK
jgi:hypothetical protein